MPAGSSTGVSPYYTGELDDVAIYNRVLSTAEIAQLASVPSYTDAPTVSAGADDLIILGGTENLSGTASDNGTGPLTTIWSQVDGPGTVTLGNVNARWSRRPRFLCLVSTAYA